MIRIAYGIVLLSLSLPVCASDQLPLRNHRSSSLVFLRPVPLGPALPQGQESRFQLAVANEMRGFPLVYEDAETWRLSWFHRQSLPDNAEWFVELPLLHRGGGVLDPVLDWWHRIFVDDGNPLRNKTPYGQSYLRLPGGQYGGATGIGDITVGLGQDLPFATARAWFKIPTGDPSLLHGSGAPDLAFSLDRTWNLSPQFAFSAHAGLTAQSRPKNLDHARGLVENASLAFAYRPDSRNTYILQWTSEASPTRIGLPPIDATHRLISLGYIHKTAQGEWSFAFMQDGDFGWFDFPGGAQIGPDWTLVFGYTFRP